MPEINLLQNRVKDTTDVWKNQSKVMLTVLSSILIIIIGGSVILYFLNQSLEQQTSAVNSDNAGLAKQLSDQQAALNSAQIFQAQLANIHILLNNHSYLSPLLDELDKVTYQKAQYTTLDVADNGQVHLEGNVATYFDLGKLLLGLSTSTEFTDVQLLSVLPSSGTTNSFIFAINMNVNPNIYFKQ